MKVTAEDLANIVIRRATREDVKETVWLLADDVLGQQRERYETPLPQSYYAAFEEIEQDSHNELVVAELAGEVIGTLQLTLIPYLTYQGGKRAQIEAVRVAEAYRSKGVGYQFFEWAITRAREKGCHMVQLTTNKNRDDAQRFYDRLGFVATHEGMKLDLKKSV